MVTATRARPYEILSREEKKFYVLEVGADRRERSQPGAIFSLKLAQHFIILTEISVSPVVSSRVLQAKKIKDVQFNCVWQNDNKAEYSALDASRKRYNPLVDMRECV